METGDSRSARPVGEWRAQQERERLQLSLGWRWTMIASLALIAGALRVALVLRYPLLYDSDAYGRWLLRDQPFNEQPWLPLFQVCLYLLTRVADSILAVRLLSAGFGVTAVLAFWLLLCRAFGPVPAYLAALLLAISPLFVLFSIVPYQEGLFLTLLFLALWLALAPGEPRWPWLALVVGLAALTRYEGWLLASLLWGLFLWRRWRAGALSWRFVVGSALALGWAPLLWIGLNRNVSPIGFRSLEPALNRASVLTMLHAIWPGWQLHLGLTGGALALAGIGWLGWQAVRRNELAWLLLAFLAGDLLVIVFLRPFSPGNLRLQLLSLPVVLTGVAGLLGEGAHFLWRRAWRQQVLARWRPLIIGGILGIVTLGLLVWELPIAVQWVAGYDALVYPAYASADDVPHLLPRRATIALLGNDTHVYAFLVYARQAGWRGTYARLDTAAVPPALLATTLRTAGARALVVYGPQTESAAIKTLVQEGMLLPASAGAGYAIWLVQDSQPAGWLTTRYLPHAPALLHHSRVVALCPGVR